MHILLFSLFILMGILNALLAGANMAHHSYFVATFNAFAALYCVVALVLVGH